MVNLDEFKKVELRIGRIVSAEKVPDTEKLLKLGVEFGEKNPEPAAPSGDGAAGRPLPDVRQIISGIAQSYPDPAVLVGVECLFATNLEPRAIKGLESRGMILTVADGTRLFLLSPTGAVPPGTQAR